MLAATRPGNTVSNLDKDTGSYFNLNTIKKVERDPTPRAAMRRLLLLLLVRAVRGDESACTCDEVLPSGLCTDGACYAAFPGSDCNQCGNQ